MKQDKITYSQRYRNECGEDGVQNRFTPYRTKKGEWVSERKVILQPRAWKNGFCLSLTITEDYSAPVYTVTDDEGQVWLHGGNNETRELIEYWVYDCPNKGNPQKPMTMGQRLLLIALNDGELRGRYADGIVNELFVEYFVLDENPNSPMRKYLPEVVAFWEKIRAQSKV